MRDPDEMLRRGEFVGEDCVWFNNGLAWALFSRCSDPLVVLANLLGFVLASRHGPLAPGGRGGFGQGARLASHRAGPSRAVPPWPRPTSLPSIPAAATTR